MTIRLSRLGRFAPLLVTLPALAGPAPASFADFSIEELANIQVTSVSKRPEQLSGAAASVYVITADDIRRAGATNLPEALRLAPNLQVGQGNGYGYSISARGMNGSNNSVANKLLVMIDGRSVYTPLFSGVFWEVQDVLLEDIERIEVISGPGGTLWGVNAVNGVIDITTRAAKESQGALAVLRGGTRGAEAAFRYGSGNLRVYGKHLDQRHSELNTGAPVDDSRHLSQVGFRYDLDGGDNRVSINGNVYRGVAEQPLPGTLAVTGFDPVLNPIISSGINLTGLWSRTLAGGGSVSVQAYADRTKRDVAPIYAEDLDVVDLQFQHSLPLVGAHSLVWGANYRRSWDEVTNGEIVAFLPAQTTQSWSSLFAQDEIALRDNLRLTVGARIERNPYTGVEFLPTARMAWTLSPTHTLWGGLSRTVRAPSRLDADAYIPGRPPFLLRGGPVVRSEVAKVVEVGYRGRPMPGTSFSVTAFHNRYDHLRTQEIDPSFTFITFSNLMEGKSSGLEMWGNAQLASNWRLSAGLVALHQRFRLKAGSNDQAGPGSARKDPSHTALLRSTYNLSSDKELEVGLRKVGALDNPAVPGYTTIDARFGWRIRPNLELSVIGHNLNGSHAEYGPVATRTEVGREFAVKLVWQMM